MSKSIVPGGLPTAVSPAAGQETGREQGEEDER